MNKIEINSLLFRGIDNRTIAKTHDVKLVLDHVNKFLELSHQIEQTVYFTYYESPR